MKNSNHYTRFIACLLVACSTCSYAEVSYNDYEGLASQDMDNSPDPEYYHDNTYVKPDRSERHTPITIAKNDRYMSSSEEGSYSSKPAHTTNYNGKVIIINPRLHQWGAYAEGKLLRSGIATAGAKWCPDLGRPCRTKTGVFYISSLGSGDCKSSRYPLGKGGAPMPYCMFFNGNQGIHGSHEVAAANISHGCVRVRVSDAKWIRYHFASIGTKVVVLSY